MKPLTVTIIAALAGVCSAQLVSAQALFELDDLTYYGTGTNRAGFVIDWNNGDTNEVVAFGYMWSAGGATMEDLISEVASAASSDLFVRWDSDAGLGAFLFGLGLQNGVATFDVTGAVDSVGDPVPSNFVNGIWDINTGGTGWEPPAAFTGQAANVGDFYTEGFGWSSYVAGSAPDFTTSVSQTSLVSPSAWTKTSLGISSVGLVDEGWYGFGWDRAPNTIPEPGTLALLAASITGWFVIRRFRASRG